jgi:hypothetical protein
MLDSDIVESICYRTLKAQLQWSKCIKDYGFETQTQNFKLHIRPGGWAGAGKKMEPLAISIQILDKDGTYLSHLSGPKVDELYAGLTLDAELNKARQERETKELLFKDLS